MREYKAPFESLDGGRIKTLSLATYRQVCNVAGSAVFLRPLSMKHDINAHFLQMPIPVYVSSMPLLINASPSYSFPMFAPILPAFFVGFSACKNFPVAFGWGARGGKYLDKGGRLPLESVSVTLILVGSGEWSCASEGFEMATRLTT